MPSEEQLTSEKSLEIIQQMISKAKNSYHDTGIGPMLWGGVIALCSLVTFMELRSGLRLPFSIWILTLVAIIPQIFIVAKEKKLNKVRSYDETVMDYLWTCFGIGIFILIFINGNLLYQIKPVFETYAKLEGAKPGFDFNSFSTSYFLLLYGFPTIVTGGMRSFKPMLYGGIVCWVFCIISIYTGIETDMLLTALAAVCAWLIPGIILWRKYKKRIGANV